MNLDELKPGGGEPEASQPQPAQAPELNPPAEPAYSAPTAVVLPQENDEPDVFDDEAGVSSDLEPDFDAEETNAKEPSDEEQEEAPAQFMSFAASATANSWSYVSSKLGGIKSETRVKAEEIFNAAKAAGHEIWFMWGMGSSAEHSTGRALDLMVRNEAAGDWIRNYIWANRSRLRLQHVIWEQHITSTVTKPGQRRLMPDRGNSTKNHFDHNHVLFLAGSYTPPATPKPPTPRPPAPKPPTGKKTNDDIVKEVIAGKWGNGDDRKNRLKKAGYNPNVIQVLVNKALRKPAKKNIDILVSEVIAGKWGNGADRKARLSKAGYDAAKVQAAVNQRLR